MQKRKKNKKEKLEQSPKLKIIIINKQMRSVLNLSSNVGIKVEKLIKYIKNQSLTLIYLKCKKYNKLKQINNTLFSEYKMTIKIMKQ